MRFLYTLLLSLCCLSVTLQGHAADVKAKESKISVYQSVGHVVADDVIEDYYTLVVSANIINAHVIQRDASNHLFYNSTKGIPAYIVNDSFASIPLFFSDTHAKAFKAKLIFPQHYYW